MVRKRCTACQSWYVLDAFAPRLGLILVNLQVNTTVMPIWNCMAVIPGFIKDEVVVVGNHRDAWVG